MTDPERRRIGRHVALLLEYDGTDFLGYQRQRRGRTVQGVLSQALETLCGHAVRLTGCSRTDAGVHAEGHVTDFWLDLPIPIDRLPLALNPLLPPDLSVREAREVPPEFHARHDATGKTYRYAVWNAPVRSALLRNRTAHVPLPLSLERMEQAARHLLGPHDFRCFRASGGPEGPTVRTLRRIGISREGPRVAIEVEGDGFLYNMVRILAGTLVEAGTGRRDPDGIPGLLASLDRRQAGKTMPPQGLTLVSVRYPDPEPFPAGRTEGGGRP